MWLCIDCGHIFEEPLRWEERYGFDYGPFEKFSGCPKCGESYVKAYKCDECNKWIQGTYIKTTSGQRICENCYITYELGEEDI